MSSIGVQFGHHALHHLFALYAVIVLTHFLLQVIFAHRSYRAAVRERANRQPFERLPTVDFVVTSYNENPASLVACLESLVRQDYPGEVRVYVVDDHSLNRDELMPIYRRFAQLPGWNILLARENRGKRAGQDAAFLVSSGELIVTIDSDTEVDPAGVTEMVRGFEDPRVGAATGDVGLRNENKNVLTRLMAVRYWLAFNQERAAQSHFRSILCCSGALAAYRRSVVQQVWEKYVTQSYRGADCTYGDDRHLTNLVLSTGHDTVYLPFARAITDTPERLRLFLRQQLRWNKSFYRELLWTLPFLFHRAPYMVFEVLVQAFLSVLMALALTSVLVLGVVDSPQRFVYYATMMIAVAVARCSYAIYRTRRLSFLLFVLYPFLSVGLLVPTRMRALLTLGDNRWGTRTAVQRAAA
jgi:hyaluronan synthase/N-acetylglucosaminyltransferase